MRYILLQKKPIYRFTKSKNQYPIIKAQTSDEIQTLENYENSTVVFVDMVLSKRATNIDLFFTRGCHKNIGTICISQSFLHLPKNTFRIICEEMISFRQTLGDNTLLFQDIAGLDMNLQEWKQLCSKYWENEYDYLQIERLAKIEEGNYTIRNCYKTTYKSVPLKRHLSDFITVVNKKTEKI